MHRFERRRDAAAWSMLAVAALIAGRQVRIGSFADEQMLVTTGWLMSQGATLYRDVFSHHFPLPYAAAAVVLSVAGKSVGAVRAAVWLYGFGVMAVALHVTRYRLSIGLFALCWAAIRVMYLGHMAIYSAWTVPAVWGVFVVTLACLTGRVRRERSAALAVGGLSAVAFLSDPLSAYTVGAAGVALLIHNRRVAFLSGATGLACVGLAVGVLVYQGAAEPFVDQAIVFNRRYNEEYLVRSPYRLVELKHTALTGLGVTDARWRNADARKPTPANYQEFDDWVFTGFAYRAALLIACLAWLAVRRPLVALWIYAFATAAQANDTVGFRAAALPALAVWTLAALAAGESPRFRFRRGPRVTLCLAAGFALAWPTLVAARYGFAPARHSERAAELAQGQAEGTRLRALACGRTDVELAGWPGGTSANWATELPPVNGYVYMWPWVADRALASTVRHLARPDALAVVVLRDDIVWGFWDTRDYLAPLYELMDSRYVAAGEGTWISPALAAACADNAGKESDNRDRYPARHGAGV